MCLVAHFPLLDSHRYLSLFLSVQSLAQVDLPLFSEPASLSQKVGNTLFEVKYERPKTNDRIIYGGLVHYDEIWRTGAGKCTTISFTTDVYIEEQKVAAGKYSLFTIPNKEEWTIILNRDATLYGSYDYTQKQDVIRIKSKPYTTDHWAEAFSISIDVVDDIGRLHLHWGSVIVSFDLETKTYDKLRTQIHEVVENNLPLKENLYANIADYILLNRSGFGEGYLNLADQLVTLAFEKEGKSSFHYRVRLDVLKLQNKRDEFMKVAREEIEYLEKEKPYEGWEISVQEVKEAMTNYNKQ